jgi:hypothetical protein
VYSNGKVFSKKRQKFLKPWPNMFGYLTIKIDNKATLLHRLLAQSFIPNPLNLETVDHIDNNKLNNDLSNLRWLSREDNAGRAGRGTYTLISPEGKIYTFTGLSEFCRLNSLTQANISKVILKQRPHHKGWRLYGK